MSKARLTDSHMVHRLIVTVTTTLQFTNKQGMQSVTKMSASCNGESVKESILPNIKNSYNEEKNTCYCHTAAHFLACYF